MKLFLSIFYFISFTALCEQSTIFIDTTAIATAIAGFIEVFYVKQNVSFEILIFGEKTRGIGDVVDGVLGKGQFYTKVRQFFPKRKRPLRLQESAVVLGEPKFMKSFGNLSRVDTDFPKPLKFLIYTTNLSLHSVTTYQVTATHRFGLFDYFLHDNGLGDIELQTYEWFTESQCNGKVIHTLNTFGKVSLAWKEPLTNYQKFSNFHNCLISVMTGWDHYYSRLDESLQHSAFDIMDVVGSKHNFTVYREPTFNKDGTASGSNDSYIMPQVIVKVDCIAIFPRPGLHYLKTIAAEVDSFLISPARPYTAYEKLLLPFDVTTWCLLILVFFIAFGVILVVNSLSEKARTIVYGEGVKMPMLNVLRAFFGIAQTRLPSGNFPRIILVYFILFCLVIRTAYQGVFFELLSTDMRKALPETLEELFAENYTFFAHDESIGSEHFVNFTIRAQGHHKNIQLINKTLFMAVFCKHIDDHKEQYAFFVGIEKKLKFLTHCKKSPAVLKETYQSAAVGLSTIANSPFTEAIEEAMELIVPTGIASFWHNWHIWTQYKKSALYPDPNGPQALRIEDLDFGFIIWLITCGCAIAVFTMELFGVFMERALMGVCGLISLMTALKSAMSFIQ